MSPRQPSVSSHDLNPTPGHMTQHDGEPIDEPPRKLADVTALCRGVSPLLLGRSIGSGGARLRVEPTQHRGGTVRGLVPLLVFAYVDGVQSTRLLTMRPGGRPVYLAAVMAGAIAPSASRLVELEQRLRVVCSHLDEPWATGLPGGCSVEVVDANFTGEIDLDVRSWVDQARRDVERAVVARAVAKADTGWVIVDGALRDIALPADSMVVGVVKSHDTQYLTDEHLHLYSLAEGEMSAAFILPAARRGQLARATCYLRQWSADGQPWTHGLVRVEVPAERIDDLPRAAATVLAGRQRPGVGDPRWDCQQEWVFMLETVLHQLMPHPLRAAA